MLARSNRKRPIRLHIQRPQYHHLVLYHYWQWQHLVTQLQGSNRRRYRSRYGTDQKQQVPLRLRQRRPRYRRIPSACRRKPHLATDDRWNPSRSGRTSIELNQELSIQVRTPPFFDSMTYIRYRSSSFLGPTGTEIRFLVSPFLWKQKISQLLNAPELMVRMFRRRVPTVLRTPQRSPSQDSSLSPCNHVSR